MASIMANLDELWRRTNLVQRVMLIGVLMACLGAGVVLYKWARQPSYSLLYSGLSPQEAAKIAEKARDDDIPYKLKDGGTTIYVSSDAVYQLRLKMAGEGLPEGGHKGYRVLEDQPIGLSPLMQDARLKQALEGELAKTIEAMDAVASARVIVVPCQSTLFASNKKQAKASVAIRVKSGHRLSSRNVLAIQHLISGGVEGLSPDMVRVVDNDLNLLSREGKSELARGASNVLDHKVQAEQYYVKKIEGLLIPVLGADRVAIQVAATIDTTSKVETMETPSEGVETRTTTTKKTSKPVGGAGGAKVVGVETTDTTAEATLTPGRTITKKVTPAGKITALSVSCMVDLSAEQQEGKEGAPAATPTITTDEIKTLVTNALTEEGITPSVEVKDTKFHRDSSLVTAGVDDQGMFTKDFILDLARRGSLGILVVAVLLALKMVRKEKKGTVTTEGVPQSGNLLTASGGGGGQDRSALRDQISHALQENPEEVKRLFLSWVQNEQGGA